MAHCRAIDHAHVDCFTIQGLADIVVAGAVGLAGSVAHAKVQERVAVWWCAPGDAGNP